jgi:mRNA interferase RelE/StbE
MPEGGQGSDVKRSIILTRTAARALSRMPANVGALVRGKLDQVASEPQALAKNLTRLKESGFSVRVGPRGSISD